MERCKDCGTEIEFRRSNLLCEKGGPDIHTTERCLRTQLAAAKVERDKYKKMYADYADLLSKETRKLLDVQANAEQIANAGDHHPALEVGDQWHQGDVIIHRLPDDFVEKTGRLVIDESDSLQIAEGTSQGSRHCLSSLDGITKYKLSDANELDGPVIHATKPFDVTHPEHGNVCGLAPGDYAFPGQRSFSEEESVRRTAD